MEIGSRTTREQRNGMRDDSPSTGGQWDNPISKDNQGKWEHREGESFAQNVAIHRFPHYDSPLADSMVSTHLGSC
jgi:hypothetical protein